MGRPSCLTSCCLPRKDVSSCLSQPPLPSPRPQYLSPKGTPSHSPGAHQGVKRQAEWPCPQPQCPSAPASPGGPQAVDGQTLRHQLGSYRERCSG